MIQSISILVFYVIQYQFLVLPGVRGHCSITEIRGHNYGSVTLHGHTAMIWRWCSAPRIHQTNFDLCSVHLLQLFKMISFGHSAVLLLLYRNRQLLGLKYIHTLQMKRLSFSIKSTTLRAQHYASKITETLFIIFCPLNSWYTVSLSFNCIKEHLNITMKIYQVNITATGHCVRFPSKPEWPEKLVTGQHHENNFIHEDSAIYFT